MEWFFLEVNLKMNLMGLVSSPNYDGILLFYFDQCFDVSCYPCE